MLHFDPTPRSTFPPHTIRGTPSLATLLQFLSPLRKIREDFAERRLQRVLPGKGCLEVALGAAQQDSTFLVKRNWELS